MGSVVVQSASDSCFFENNAERGCDGGPMLGVTMGAREQRVFAIERDGRMDRSTALLSISICPSSMKRLGLLRATGHAR